MANYVDMERAKLQRNLRRIGKSFTFIRTEKNTFGEPKVEGTPKEITLTGIFHETSSHITVTSADAATTQSKAVPMVLCDWVDYSEEPLEIDDNVWYNARLYRVTGVKDLGEAHIAADISLEAVQ